jgi:hypothetical protein
MWIALGGAGPPARTAARFGNLLVTQESRSLTAPGTRRPPRHCRIAVQGQAVAEDAPTA